MNPHIDIRIDIKHTFFHHFGFIFSYRFSRCDNLAVQIGETHLIIVNQVKSTDPTPHQCLTDIAADTSDAKYGNPAVFQFFHCFFAEKQLRSRKLI